MEAKADKLYHPDALVRLLSSELSAKFIQISFDLDVYAKVPADGIAIAELSPLLKLPESSCRLFVQYLCTVGLLEYDAGMVRLTRLAKSMAEPANREWISHLRETSRRLAEDLDNQLKNPRRQIWHGIRYDEREVDSAFYTGWYHERRMRWGQELARQYDFSRHKRLLDIGGACGGWCAGILREYPDLHCAVFDLPEVCRQTRKAVSDEGLEEKIAVVPGSFFDDELPNDMDVVLLANVLHDWPVRDNAFLISKVFSALPAGGVLLVKEFFFNNNYEGPLWAAVQGVSVLGADGESGWQPSCREMREILSAAGFSKVTESEDLLIATK